MKTNKYKPIRKRYQEEISSFEGWLKKRSYVKETVRADSSYTASFLAWAEQEQNRVTEVIYNDLLTFIDHCTTERATAKGLSTASYPPSVNIIITCSIQVKQ